MEQNKKTFVVLSTEGNPDELTDALKPIVVMGMMDEEARTRLLIAGARGKGEPLTYHEAALLMRWAFKTLMTASLLESAIVGTLDVVVSEDENEFSFGLTPEGEQTASNAITQAIARGHVD